MNWPRLTLKPEVSPSVDFLSSFRLFAIKLYNTGALGAAGYCAPQWSVEDCPHWRVFPAATAPSTAPALTRSHTALISTETGWHHSRCWAARSGQVCECLHDVPLVTLFECVWIITRRTVVSFFILNSWTYHRQEQRKDRWAPAGSWIICKLRYEFLLKSQFPPRSKDAFIYTMNLFAIDIWIIFVWNTDVNSLNVVVVWLKSRNKLFIALHFLVCM